MDIGEAILSDALVGSSGHEVGESVGENRYGIVRSRFEFWNPLREEEYSADDKDANAAVIDSEGDFDDSRRPSCRDCLIIDHTMATTLADVGLQIWHGALLLCDYVLYRPDEVRQRIALDLGCGAGLTSLCAGLAGSNVVFATDYDVKTLQMTQRNVELNSDLLPDQGKNIRPRRLDWRTPLITAIESWPESDQKLVQSVSVILAADVIYDTDLNTALFDTIERLCDNGTCDKTVLVSLEKRLNFTVAEMDVACPAYTHFLEWMDEALLKGWVIEKIDTGEVPVCFNYKRNSDMELWRFYVPGSADS